MVLKSSLHNH